MDDALLDHQITCPHCWEPHNLVIDISAGTQTCIEDCSVCCHPIEVTVTIDGDALVGVDVEATQ